MKTIDILCFCSKTGTGLCVNYGIGVRYDGRQPSCSMRGRESALRKCVCSYNAREVLVFYLFYIFFMSYAFFMFYFSYTDGGLERLYNDMMDDCACLDKNTKTSAKRETKVSDVYTEEKRKKEGTKLLHSARGPILMGAMSYCRDISVRANSPSSPEMVHRFLQVKLILLNSRSFGVT